MAKRSICTVNNRKIFNPDKVDMAIFEYLLCHKEGTTQTQMEFDLHITQPTISNRLKKIGIDPFMYGDDTYIIVKERGRFQLIKLENLSVFLDKKATIEQKREFNESIQKAIRDFVDFNMFEEKYADAVTESVILYKIKEKYYEKIKSILYELYNNCIYDILPCKQGLYIILDTAKLGKNVADARDSILSLYSEVAKIIHSEKVKRRRAKKESEN